MELIDRDEAIKAINDVLMEDDQYKVWLMLNIINLKTVDAEPVRHGRWIVEYEVKDGRSMRCSECHMVFWVGSGRDGNYCPNCGADMKGENNE